MAIMKKYALIFSISLGLAILLSACGFTPEPETEAQTPLDAAAWPTPKPSPSTSTPTPFPKATLAPTPTTEASPATAATPDARDGLNLSGNPLELAQQINTLTGLTPIGATFITVDESTIHQRPAEAADVLDTLRQGDITAALGKNNAGDWIYVITSSLVQGWLPLENVRLAGGNLAEAPVLPPDQADTAASQAIASTSSALDTGGDSMGGQPSIFTELAPVGTAFVTVDGLPIRKGPSTAYGVVDTLEQGEVAGILGKNPADDWLYIATLTPALGWVPIDSLRIVGGLEALRVLPPDPVAALLNQSTASSSDSAASRQTIDVDELGPIAAAQVNNALLNLRQRPGAEYQLLDTLSQGDEVTILALNRDKEWALVKTAAGQLGWGSVDFLVVDGSLANATQVQTLTPGEDHPADQVAPMVRLSGVPSEAVAAAASDNPASPAAQAAAVSTGGQELSLLANTLVPVAAGKGAEKFDLRRGPGLEYGTVAELTVDEPVTVLAVNRQRDWAVVQTPLSEVGWVPLSSLTITEGSLENAAATVSAWVKSNGLEVKNGPGIYFDTVGTLAIHNLVSVIALDQGRSWAMVETITGGRGWIPLRFVDITGPLEQIPQISATEVAQSVPDTQPALPSPSGPPTGKLVFQTSSGGDIMLIDADGTGLRRLTNGIDPVLSPDGQQVAFTRWEGETGSLWTIGVDGSNERQILGFIKQAKGPEWSPDGSQIVLNFQHGGRLEDKPVKIDLTTHSRPNIPRNATGVRVSVEDGTPFLKYTLPPDPHWSLRLVNVADGSFEDLYGGVYAFRPAWDPGQPWRIVSDSGNGLLAVDVNRDDFRQPLTDNVNDGTPAFSPDGRFIALVTNVQGGHDIFRMNADGSGRVRLTQTPLWVPVQPDSDSKQWNNVAPAWSPDGSRIAFLTDRAGRWEIWIMNADGSDQHPMLPEAVNDQLDITYNFVDERVLSWR